MDNCRMLLNGLLVSQHLGLLRAGMKTFMMHHVPSSTLIALAKTLGEYLKLSSALSYEAVVQYIDLLCCLKPTTALKKPSYNSTPPDSLTVNVHEFLKVCLDISDDTAKLAWTSLWELADRSFLSCLHYEQKSPHGHGVDPSEIDI